VDQNGPFEILLVEDNPADVMLIREALALFRVPFRLQTAGDGESALDLVFPHDGMRGCPDLIILDLNLPKLSGHEVLQTIKTDERTRTVPVIVMSSSDSPGDVQRAYEFHANSYVRKPGNLDDLFRIVLSIETFWFGTAKLPKTGGGD
jgi:two-component system, chemotaxis family, response regulator Rcp1